MKHYVSVCSVENHRNPKNVLLISSNLDDDQIFVFLSMKVNHVIVVCTVPTGAVMCQSSTFRIARMETNRLKAKACRCRLFSVQYSDIQLGLFSINLTNCYFYLMIEY